MRTIQRARSVAAGIACAIAASTCTPAAAAPADAHRVLVTLTGNAVTQTTYAIGFHAISPGGSVMSNSCYRFRGTLGQTAPGYSSGNIYALMAGYWQFMPPPNPDEIFYNGVEDC